MGIFTIVFPEGASEVNTCIEGGYAGVVSGKLERWPKLVRDQAIFSIKKSGWGKAMYATDQIRECILMGCKA